MSRDAAVARQYTETAGQGPVPGGAIGDDVRFATKPELVRQMTEREGEYAAELGGVRIAWREPVD